MSNSDFKLKDERFFKTGGAQADNDGISIASSRVQGEIVTAQFNSLGNINVFRQNKSIAELNEEQERIQESMNVRSIARAIAITIYVFCILLCVIARNRFVTIGTLVFILNAFYTRFFVYTVTWIANVISIRTREKMLKNNGALHMVLNAFQEEKKIPTIEEVKKTTCYSERSSTNEISKVALKALLQCVFLTVLIIALVVIAVDAVKQYQTVTALVLLLVIAAIGTTIAKAVFDCIELLVDKGFENEWLMRLMQKPFMKQPTEKELELALEALKGYEKMEEEIDENFTDYEPVSMQIDLVNKKIIFNLLNGRQAKYSYSEYLEFLINRSNSDEEDQNDDGTNS